MIHFYFNDCFPKTNNTEFELKNLLTNILTEYKTIRQKFSNNIEGVVTRDLASNILLTKNGFSLLDCIKSLDKENKIAAISLFIKYPIDNFYNIKDEYYEKNYYYIIENQEIDAQNITIAGLENGIIFSLPVYNELKQNILKINSEDNYNFEIINF